MAGKKDIVEQALKMVMGAGEKTAPSVLVAGGKDTPISAWHLTEKPFASYDWGLLGSTTRPNVEGTGVENWAMDLARVGPWSSEKKIDLGYGIHIPIAVGGKGKAFNSLDELQTAIARAGGPDKFRQNMTAKGFGHLKVADEEFGGTSYVSLTPETFMVRDDQIDRASGGSIREGYGPGGWVDDVVKMAGKVISGEGEDAAKAVGIIPGTFPGKKLPNVDALARNVDKFVYHSGVAEDIPSMRHGVDPQIGPWVQEVLNSATDEDDLLREIQENAVPVSWWSKEPSWAVVKVARKLGKRVDEVTPEDLAAHGHVALIPKKDPEAESMYWVGEQGLSNGPYSEVEDITGRKLKAYETDLYSGNYGPEGVERNEYITPRSVEPYLHLTGNELLDFLRKTGAYNKAHGGRIAKGPGGWLDDVVKMAGKVISGEGEDAAKAGIRAYHGSPHDFDRFDMSKIGTGEGAQAYGHGLYFADKEEIAQHYRDALSSKFQPKEASAWISAAGGDKDAAVKKYMEDMGVGSPAVAEWEQKNRPELWAEKMRTVDAIRNYTPGHMYEVNINADPDTFLDWDKPLSEQSEAVRKAPSIAALIDEDRAYVERYPSGFGERLGANVITKVPERQLAAEGIPGIKYLDAGSRGAGDGTRNYVVFDDKLISIIRKYGIAGASAMLGYNLMENLDPKQAQAASMADQDFQASRPQRSTGGNNSVSNAMNVARGLYGEK